jgi:undecaprenyl-diphosphatase
MGAVQGLTEFLPVSSSGHLVIFSNLFHLQDPTSSDAMFDILLHLGTLFAVVIDFWKDIIGLIKEFFSVIADIFRGKFTFKRMSPYRRFLFMIIVATLPLFLILPFKDGIESLFNNLTFVGGALMFTGVLLWLSDKVVRGGKTMENTSVGNALVVGLFQMVATVPGISRSGSTISAGLFCGFSREYAIKFSFIMSLPAIGGACILQLLDAAKSTGSIPILPYLAGIITAAVTGYAAIRLLNYIMKNDKFKYFAVYCLIVGFAVLLYQLF